MPSISSSLCISEWMAIFKFFELIQLLSKFTNLTYLFNHNTIIITWSIYTVKVPQLLRRLDSQPVHSLVGSNVFSAISDPIVYISLIRRHNLLPFLKKSKDAGAAAPIESLERKPDEPKDEDFDSLEVAAEDILSAMKANDAKALASALRAAFELLEMQPHQEVDHE